MNLGKALVKELKLASSVDTLSRWMAHYIAEQMEIAQSSVGEVKIEAEIKCFETILKLWQRRSSLSFERKPFENFETIFRVLERIDPENQQPFYFKFLDEGTRRENQSSKVSEEVQHWLDIATEIDMVVRIWLDYVFKQAALFATDEATLEWMENSIDLIDSHETSIIFSLLDGEPGTVSNSEKRREQITSRMQKLEAFTEFNHFLMSVYQKELEELSINDMSHDDGSN